jgi:hypothetical protein
MTGCDAATCARIGVPSLSVTTQPQIEPADLVGAKIVAGEDRDPRLARLFSRRRCRLTLDLRMGMRRAQEVGVGLSRRRLMSSV